MLQQIPRQRITIPDTKGSYKSIIKIQITEQEKDNNPVGQQHGREDSHRKYQ